MKTVPPFTMSFTVSADREERRRIVQDLDARKWEYPVVRSKARHASNHGLSAVKEEWMSVYATDDGKTCKWCSSTTYNYEARFKVAKKIVMVKLSPHEGKFQVDIPLHFFNGNQSSPFMIQVETPKEIPDAVNSVLRAYEAKTMKDIETSQNIQDRKMKIMREHFGEGFVIDERHNSYAVRIDGTNNYGFDLGVNVYLDEDDGDILQVSRIDSFNIGSPQLLERVKELMRMIALQAKMEEIP